MLTQTAGKLQMTPYLLFAHSPPSQVAGFVRGENAWVGSFLADYSFNSAFSLGIRYEHAHNDSDALDTSSNADLIGFGSGSSAGTMTLTPAYTLKQLTIRAEYSHVSAGGNYSQTRLGGELELQF